ncbi:NADPH-dependent FMN reductase [Janibacter sp. GXQ6167]|uniref:NADPH-dependent FMN reductase n=1 Tax=Janibacter sp. GXQ6167 TaxID=3240791 RepID=UPI003525CD16
MSTDTAPTTTSEQTRVPVIGVLVGSTRPTRIGRDVADQVAEMARLRSEATVEVVDLAEVGPPLLDEPRMPAKGDYVREHTKAWKQVIDGLDAVIVVSAQYNGGYPAPLKNAIDTLYAEWNDKPILLVTYGYHGGVRAAEQLRVVFGVVRADVLDPTVAITVTDADRDEEGHLTNACDVVERHRAELEVGFAAIHAALGC